MGTPQRLPSLETASTRKICPCLRAYPGRPLYVRQMRGAAWCRACWTPCPQVLPALAWKGYANQPLGATLATVKLMEHFAEARRQQADELQLALREFLLLLQEAPEIIGAFDELVHRMADVGVADCEVELGAAKDVLATFDPVLDVEHRARVANRPPLRVLGGGDAVLGLELCVHHLLFPSPSRLTGRCGYGCVSHGCVTHHPDGATDDACVAEARPVRCSIGASASE